MNLDGPLIDALLEHGITDKQLTLLKNLDAVEYLLKTLHEDYDGMCIGCDTYANYGDHDAHARDCKVMLSRIAVGQHTLEAELEAAENEARRENERRSVTPATRRPAYTVEQMNITLRSLFSPERITEALRAPAFAQPSALIVNQRDYEALQRSGADMNAGSPGFSGIAVQSNPLVREGQALMFRAEDWAKAGPAAVVHQSGGANGAALCGAALDNNPGSSVTCPDCLKRLYGPGTVGR